MRLRLYGNTLTLYGDALTLYQVAVADADVRQPGGWLPVIYVDAKGRPVSLDRAAKMAVAAAPEAEKAEIRKVADRVIEAEPADFSGALTAAMIADILALAAALQDANAALYDGLMQLARDEWMREDEAAAFLLLMA